MSQNGVQTTSDSSTAMSRDKQPVALTDKQKGLIEKTWKIVEEDVGLLKGGIILFMRLVGIVAHNRTFIIFPYHHILYKKNYLNFSISLCM